MNYQVMTEPDIVFPRIRRRNGLLEEYRQIALIKDY
jgi:hypothetical protein